MVELEVIIGDGNAGGVVVTTTGGCVGAVTNTGGEVGCGGEFPPPPPPPEKIGAVLGDGIGAAIATGATKFVKNDSILALVSGPK